MVSWLQALKNILAQVTGTNTGEPIMIPYGRHTYGPRPTVVGVGGVKEREVTLRKSAGSRIGNFCSISPGLRFTFLDKHNYHWGSTYPFYAFYDNWRYDVPPNYIRGEFDVSTFEANPIIIENDVWIASNVTVKEGVTIGNGAVVAMESLVTKDVPPYAVVGGCPAKIIKYRFEPAQIEELLKIAWWNWTDEKIRHFVPLLMSEDIDAFIRAAKKSESTTESGEKPSIAEPLSVALPYVE